MPATIKLNVQQLKDLISQFSADEKEEIAKYMDRLTLKDRLEKFISRKKDISVSFEEITEEVEKAREERYR